MSQKKFSIISLAAALASLGNAATAAVPASNEVGAQPTDTDTTSADKPQANMFYQVGHDLLGMIVTEREDGTLFAGHSSHSSHASHSSHSSHHSSR